MFAARRLTIRRLRDFQRHHRPLLGDAQNMAAMRAPAEIGENIGLDLDSRGAQQSKALAGDARIGIVKARHHPRHAGSDDGFGAGRGLAMMGAGFKRDIERGAARGFARLREGERFGVRASAGRRPAAPKHDSILDDQRADRRIGRRGAKITPSEGQSG